MNPRIVMNHLCAQADRRLVKYDEDAALNIVDLGQPQGAGNKCVSLMARGRPRLYLAGLLRTVAAGTVRVFRIIAATDALGTNATPIVEHALSEAPDAVGDSLFLDCTVEQARAALPQATHIGVQLQLSDADDECVILFERTETRWRIPCATEDYVS